jgi:hypothetical protein
MSNRWRVTPQVSHCHRRKGATVRAPLEKFIADIAGPLFFGGLILVFFGAAAREMYRVFTARRLWSEARSAGLQYEGDFPNVCIKRPQVTFKLEASVIGKGDTFYAQAYLAELPSKRSARANPPELKEALDRAAKEGLRVTFEDGSLTATAEGVALPGEAILRLNIVEQILRALA